jgi:hypothetical protein
MSQDDPRHQQILNLGTTTNTATLAQKKIYMGKLFHANKANFTTMAIPVHQTTRKACHRRLLESKMIKTI